MINGINTSQDGTDYDHVPLPPDRITDANALYDAWLMAKNGSDWKPKVQIFEMHWLSEISHLQKEIRNRTYKPQVPTQFITRERGKERAIRGEQVRDRVVEHSLNDNVVVPSIKPYLIYNNGASLKGKGVEFTRKELVKDLVNYYSHHGNDGYILLIDYSKYYDNIRHDKLMDLFREYISDDTALRLLDVIIGQFKVDVSYMDDAEYADCITTLFDSLDYATVDPNLLTGEKFMAKHLDIGNQTSQSAGILYPTPIDSYVKIVKGEKYYARYMDDSYCIHESKEHLTELRMDVIMMAKDSGITVNESKSRIVKLSSYWRFLQIEYSLTATGRIIRKVNPRQLTTMRRKMKILSSRMTVKEYKDWVHSWTRSHRKYMSNQQFVNIRKLYSQEVKRCRDWVPNPY